MDEVRLVVCVNERLGPDKKSCGGSGSRELIKMLLHRFEQAKLAIPVVEQVCLGRCEEGITMRIAPGGPFFTQVTALDLDTIEKKLIDFYQEFNVECSR
ncbi:MAG: (2Fe-2S) ferredoxin domain-containing protein [Gammaproteobacteria bacterium]|nr:(2Fe-2S) ferredoxin domain-containing protein [Gammaproteobacteria bacterium]